MIACLVNGEKEVAPRLLVRWWRFKRRLNGALRFDSE